MNETVDLTEAEKRSLRQWCLRETLEMTLVEGETVGEVTECAEKFYQYIVSGTVLK
jgi:hypothetical protein